MSKETYRLILFIAIILFFYDTSFSQKNTKITNDFESWSSVGFTYKPIKKITLGIEQNLRLNKNSTQIEQYFTQFNIDYKLLKKIELGLAFRQIRSQEIESNGEGVYENSNRINFDITYKNSLKRFDYSFRSRYQNKKEINETKETVRFKTKIGYNIKKWKLDPNLSGEIFYRTNENFNRYRITLSTDVDITKRSKLKIFALFEKELNDEFPKSAYAVGLAFTHKLKFKKS